MSSGSPARHAPDDAAGQSAWALSRWRNWRCSPRSWSRTQGTARTDPGSLRYAIQNLSAGTNTINFDIAGSGVHTIQPTSALPLVTEPVFIDGTTQPGYAGSPLIQIDGSQVGSSFVDGLYITAGNSTVKGLDITGFTGTAIVLDTGGSNVIENNYLGADPTGTIADGNKGGGLDIYGSASNQIVQNVISVNSFTSGSANGSAGVYVANAGANGNVFTDNFIGTNKIGTASVGNGGVGIYVAGGAQNTRIGTDGDGVNDTAERNVISGNSYDGIVIQGTSSGANTTGTIVAGNYIGANVAGTAALPNGSDGVLLDGGAQSSRIGVNGSDPDAVAEQNVISGNIGQGVAISDSGTSSNVVAGNLIGAAAAGTAALPNYYGGIDILSGASSNRIGFDGTSSTAVAALERNVISGNGSIPGEAGIYVADAGTNLNVIAGNYIGVDSSGAIAMANSGSGVFLDSGAENNRIGSDGNGVMDPSKANVIAGNIDEGVTIRGTSSGANTTGNIVAGNFIGTNAAGTAALGNKSYGIWINGGAQSNRVGTNGTDADVAGEGNVIAGNGNYMPGNFRSGVAISDPGANLNLVAGNWIGTNKTGTTSLPNAQDGVDIFNGAQNNQVGGSARGPT